MATTTFKSDYPIYHICRSPRFREYILTKIGDGSTNPLLIGDYGPGWSPEVEFFFAFHFWPMVKSLDPATEICNPRKVIVYGIDLHEMRMANLFHKFREESILDKCRAIHARLETMTEKALFPKEQFDYVKSLEQSSLTAVDHSVVNQQKLPLECFDVGILNNDMVGFLVDYYKEYSNVVACLGSVRSTLKKGAFLVVTQPGALFPTDNITLLNERGFRFHEALDIDTKTGQVTIYGEQEALEKHTKICRLDHYGVLVFEAV